MSDVNCEVGTVTNAMVVAATELAGFDLRSGFASCAFAVTPFVCVVRCNVCGKEFFEKALFRRHVKKATHGKKGRVKQNLERECEHCGRKFTQLREYRRHINNHQGKCVVQLFSCRRCFLSLKYEHITT